MTRVIMSSQLIFSVTSAVELFMRELDCIVDSLYASCMYVCMYVCSSESLIHIGKARKNAEAGLLTHTLSLILKVDEGKNLSLSHIP